MSGSVPPMTLAHDDNLITYTRSDTTLIVASQSFELVQAKVDNLRTRRLLLYSSTILLNGRVSCPGREIQLHCNQFKWARDATLDVSGADGKRLPAVNPDPSINGQDGGSIHLHVHNLEVSMEDQHTTYWPYALSLQAGGGKAGQYHKNARGTEWIDGQSGRSGQ